MQAFSLCSIPYLCMANRYHSMKKLLLLLAFFPLLAQGQGIEYGFNGGISSNTAPLGVIQPTGVKETGWLPSYAGAFDILLNLGPWQIGLCAEAYELKTIHDVITPDPAGDLHNKTTKTYASPEVPVMLQINRVFYQQKSHIYFGIAGWSGLNLLKDAGNRIYYNELHPIFGAQLGYTYGLSNVIGLNVNLAARYNMIPGNPILSIPLTVGIRIRP